MRTKTINLYTIQELKEQFPDAYDHAYEKYKNDWCNEVPWGDEIIDSLKAIFKVAGIRMDRWEIDGICGPSYIKIWDSSDFMYLSGQRAVAWLENNLYGPLRITKNNKENLKYNRAYTDKQLRPYSIGKIPPCPFTGVCYDEDYIDALNKAIKDGDTIKEAFEGLADVAGKLRYEEYKYQMSEECFLDTSSCNEWEYDENGDIA